MIVWTCVLSLIPTSEKNDSVRGCHHFWLWSTSREQHSHLGTIFPTRHSLAAAEWGKQSWVSTGDQGLLSPGHQASLGLKVRELHEWTQAYLQCSSGKHQVQKPEFRSSSWAKDICWASQSLMALLWKLALSPGSIPCRREGMPLGPWHWLLMKVEKAYLQLVKCYEGQRSDFSFLYLQN